MSKHFMIGIVVIVPAFILAAFLAFDKVQCNCDDSKVCDNNVSNLDENISNVDDDIVKDKEYDCSFTKTYRILDLLEGYKTEVPDLSYIVVDSYQSNNPISHVIPVRLKEDLVVGNWYEFTYNLEGKGNINSMLDIVNVNSYYSDYGHISSDNLRIYLDIKETDKRGMEQIAENINVCM